MKKTSKVNKLSIFVLAAYFQFFFYITNSYLEAVRLVKSKQWGRLYTKNQFTFYRKLRNENCFGLVRLKKEKKQFKTKEKPASGIVDIL